MTPVEMRIAKKELHKVIVDTLLMFEPEDDEIDELWAYVETLAKFEQKRLDILNNV